MKTLICCIGMLLCFIADVRAKEEPVILRKEQVTHRDIDDRSIHIYIPPVVTHDGRTVYIRLAFPYESMLVTVEDESGIVVFSESWELYNEELFYSFEIEDAGAKVYRIEIKLDDVLYLGDFVVQ